MLYHILAAAAVLASVNGCGKAKPAKEQVQGKVDVPNYPSDSTQRLQLTEQNANLVLNINLVFWEPLPGVKQVSDLLEATQQTRLLKAAALDDLSNVIIPAKASIGPTAAAYAEFQPRIDAARQKLDQNAIRTFEKPIANALFSDRLKELLDQGKITAAEGEHAQNLWHAYCEAKLWELGASPLMQRQYTDRPTPVQLCEAYYAEQKYFQGPSCEPAAAGSGKNFFACIWREGVLKSALFPKEYREQACVASAEAGATTAASMLDKWVAADGSGALQDALAKDESGALRSAILDKGFLPRAFLRKFAAFGACKNAFARGQSGGQDQGVGDPNAKPWPLQRPVDLLLIGEANPSDSQPPYSLFKHSDDDRVNKENDDKLTAFIRSFSKRANHLEPSYSDEKFNVVIGTPLVTSAEARDLVEKDPVLAKLQQFESPEMKTLKEQQAAALAASLKAKATYDESWTKYKAVTLPAIDKNRLDAAAAGSAKGATVFLNNYSMSMRKVGHELHVTLAFDLTSVQLKGCVDVDSGAQCPITSIEAAAAAPQVPVIDVAFDRAANMVRCKFNLGDHPELLGFPVLTRSPGSIQFNEIPPEALKGKTVELETYGNQLRELSLVTGNGYIVDSDGATRLFTGSLTGDNFPQRELELKTTYGIGP